MNIRKRQCKFCEFGKFLKFRKFRTIVSEVLSFEGNYVYWLNPFFFKVYFFVKETLKNNVDSPFKSSNVHRGRRLYQYNEADFSI